MLVLRHEPLAGRFAFWSARFAQCDNFGRGGGRGMIVAPFVVFAIDRGPWEYDVPAITTHIDSIRNTARAIRDLSVRWHREHDVVAPAGGFGAHGFRER